MARRKFEKLRRRAVGFGGKKFDLDDAFLIGGSLVMVGIGITLGVNIFNIARKRGQV